MGAVDLKKEKVNTIVKERYYKFVEMVLAQRVEASQAWEILITPLVWELLKEK